jgi:hypothetical protein
MHALKFAAVASGVGMALTTSSYAAEQEWWFDVEVILFERNTPAGSVTETFNQADLSQNSSNLIDLLSAYMHPDLSFLHAGLPYCRASKRLEQQEQYDKDYAFPVNVSAQGLEQTNTLANEDDLPVFKSLPIPEQLETPQADSFEYEVVSDDIFAKTEVTQGLGQRNNPSEADLTDNLQLAEQDTAPTMVESDYVRPPIQVEWVEWQLPTSFPCVYAEQIDAELVLLNDADLAATDKDKMVKSTPIKIDGVEWQEKRGPFLIPQSATFMGDLYESISKQRDISPILHMSWRQQVTFGRENAQGFRLFAGQNYAQDFDTKGMRISLETDSLFASLIEDAEVAYVPKEEQVILSNEENPSVDSPMNNQKAINDELFVKIEQALADESPINFNIDVDKRSEALGKVDADNENTIELWQIDGQIAVYLRNVGRIPYLHIDSNLDYRQPVFNNRLAPPLDELSSDTDITQVTSDAINMNQIPQANYLQSANFNQLRRVISKQVHYFDHPLFGMIVRINRFKWPEVIETENIDPEPQEE